MSDILNRPIQAKTVDGILIRLRGIVEGNKNEFHIAL